MKKIKILSFILALLLLVSSLAACTPADNNDNSDSTTDAPESVSPEELTSPTDTAPAEDPSNKEQDENEQTTEAETEAIEDELSATLENDFYFSAIDNESYAVYIAASSTATSLTLPTTFEGKKVTKFGGVLGKEIYLTDLTIPEEITTIDYKYNILHDWDNVNVHVSSLSHWFESHVDLPYEINLYVDGERIAGQLIVPEGVTVIKEGTLIPIDVVSITLPASLTKIEAGKFSSIREVINYSPINVKAGAQSNGGIAKNAIYVHSEEKSKLEFIDGFVFAGDTAIAYVGDTTDLIFPDREDRPYNVDTVFFSSIHDVTSIVFSDSVVKIGDSAFAYCEKLTSVTVSSSVTNIGKSAFEGCDALTEVIFAEPENWFYSALVRENFQSSYEDREIYSLEDELSAAMNLKYILCSEAWFKKVPDDIDS